MKRGASIKDALRDWWELEFVGIKVAFWCAALTLAVILLLSFGAHRGDEVPGVF